MRRGIAALLALAATSLPGRGAAHDRSLIIRNARLIDATGAAAQEGSSILIRDGRIADIGPAIDAPDVPALDASGATVIPGLIDVHVHLASVPGAEVRRDSPARVRELRRQHLCSYLACGVTTVLDAATDVATAREIRGWLADGHPGPTVLTLGPPIAAPGGYMSSGPGIPVASVEEIDALLDTIAGLDAAGVKVPLERGFGSDAIFPIHPPEVRAAIARKAAERGLRIHVHASDEVEQTMALDMGAHALMHLNFGGREPSPAFVARAARSGTYVATTFSTIDAGLARWHPERLEDPLVRLVVPEEERRTALSAEDWALRDRIDLAYAFPRLPDVALRLLAWLRPPQEAAEVEALTVNQRAARTLHRAGIPIVIGSDAGNTMLLSQFHGTSTLREMELLVEAGIENDAVLRAATAVAARMVGVDGEAGTLEVGKRADLVVLDGDPTVDIGAIRRIRWTVKDGVARTPAEWMRAGARSPGGGEPATAGLN